MIATYRFGQNATVTVDDCQLKARSCIVTIENDRDWHARVFVPWTTIRLPKMFERSARARDGVAVRFDGGGHMMQGRAYLDYTHEWGAGIAISFFANGQMTHARVR